MIEYLKNKVIDDDLLNAPKIKRTHCYIQFPYVYDIECLLCGGKKIHWSEFENHIWCYDCEKDVLLIHKYAGIFGGPIGMELTKLMGISFDRVNVKTNEVLKMNIVLDNKEFNDSWVRNDKLIAYNKFIDEKIKKEK